MDQTFVVRAYELDGSIVFVKSFGFKRSSLSTTADRKKAKAFSAVAAQKVVATIFRQFRTLSYPVAIPE